MSNRACRIIYRIMSGKIKLGQKLKNGTMDRSVCYFSTMDSTLHLLFNSTVVLNFKNNLMQAGTVAQWPGLSPNSKNAAGSISVWTFSLCLYGFSPGTLASFQSPKSA